MSGDQPAAYPVSGWRAGDDGHGGPRNGLRTEIAAVIASENAKAKLAAAGELDPLVL